MGVWDIYDEYGNWLGTTYAFMESEAVERAKAQGMTKASSAKLCED